MPLYQLFYGGIMRKFYKSKKSNYDLSDLEIVIDNDDDEYDDDEYDDDDDDVEIPDDIHTINAIKNLLGM